MKQLSALDAAFLYAETARSPMHLAGLQIYDPGQAPRGRLDFEAIVRNVERRLHRVECFHRRLVEVPLHLDHPYWVEAAHVDARKHVTLSTLPAPGDWHSLCRRVAEIHATRLDRSQPLWEMHVLQGLEGIEDLPAGCYGVLTKIHHAAVDGMGGIAVTAALHDLEPAAEAPADLEETQGRPLPPLPGELLARAGFRLLAAPYRVLSAWPKLREIGRGTPWPAESAPRTRFARGVSRERVFDAVSLSLADVRRVKAAVSGATVNDVLLTLVGGALRAYLGARGELPRKSLSALVPVDVRGREALHGGNRLLQLTTSLATQVEDPLERLRVVHAASEKAKRALARYDPGAIGTASELAPPPLAQLAARVAGSNPLQPLFNTVVSNLPGPAVPMYSCGARLIKAYGVGPVTAGAPLFHTALSYCGELTLSVASSPQALPDIEAYMALLRASYSALTAAASPGGVTRGEAALAARRATLESPS